MTTDKVCNCDSCETNNKTVFNNKIRSIVRTLLVTNKEMKLSILASFITENHRVFKLGNTRGISTIKLRNILLEKNNHADIVIDNDTKIVRLKR